MKTRYIYHLTLASVFLLICCSTASAVDQNLNGNIAAGYHIANPGNITIDDNSTVVTGRTVLCVATGTMGFGSGFSVESGAVFWAFSGTPSEISETIDYDVDGLPDYWEFYYFTSIEGQDASDDSDNDGSMNMTEYTLGYDPDDNTSKPPSGLSYEYDELGRIIYNIQNP